MHATMSPFERALALEPLGEGLLRAVIPDGWMQGKGAFGGLVMAVLVRAIEGAEPDRERRLRAVTGEIPGPVTAGEAEVRVEVLRRGRGVTTARAALVQGGETLAQATGVLGTARAGLPAWQKLAPPAMPPWRTVEPVPFIPGMMPAFLEHLEIRNLGPTPFSGEDAHTAEGWVRPRGPMGEPGAAWLAAMVDVWWPCALVRFDAPRPTATITFTLERVGETEGLDPDEPLFYRAHSPVAAEGYSVEFRELWGSDGRLLALNQQTFVLIK